MSDTIAFYPRPKDEHCNMIYLSSIGHIRMLPVEVLLKSCQSGQVPAGLPQTRPRLAAAATASSTAAVTPRTVPAITASVAAASIATSVPELMKQTRSRANDTFRQKCSRASTHDTQLSIYLSPPP